MPSNLDPPDSPNSGRAINRCCRWQFKAPFGLEQLTSDTILLTPERTLVTGALTPERQIGVQLWGKPLSSERPAQRDLFSYALGVFNGNGRNTTANDNNDFMLAARLESTVLAGKISSRAPRHRLARGTGSGVECRAPHRRPEGRRVCRV